MKYFILFALFIFNIFNVGFATENKYLLSEKNWKLLTQINKLIDSGQQQQAIDQLQNFLAEGKHKPYDMAIAEQSLGYAYRGVYDYNSAIRAFQNALLGHALPSNVMHDLEFNLAQLFIAIKNYDQGLDYFNRWIQMESNPSLDAYLLAAGAYYESEQYKAAIPYVKNVIQLKASYDETWHQVLLACYLKVQQYENAANLLEKMLRFQPDNKNYWQQLLATWQYADNNKKTLATMELMLSKDLFKGDEVKQLINLYLYLGLPSKAATLLESQLQNGQLQKDLANWKLLGNSWLQAQEYQRSAEALSKAAVLSKQGDIDFRIGQIYFDLGNYGQATSHLKTALSKGLLKQANDAQLLLGIALFHQADNQQAMSAFEAAKKQASTSDQADWWIQRINDLQE